MPRYGTHRRTGRYNDWGKTYKACSMAILESGKALNSLAITELTDVATTYLKDQDAIWPHSTTAKSKSGRTMKFGGDANHPWWSGQTHDSVAVRIMQANRIAAVRYMQPSPDTGKPQHTNSIKNIVGTEWAHRVAEEGGPRYFLPGVQVQLIVGVPYAESVNESSRHMGFVDNLSNELFNYVYNWIDGGGLTRNTVIATDKGAKIIKTKNYKYTR